MAPSSYYWTISFMYLVVAGPRRCEVRQEKRSKVGPASIRSSVLILTSLRRGFQETSPIRKDSSISQARFVKF